jgi:hypothetical protein
VTRHNQESGAAAGIGPACRRISGGVKKNSVIEKIGAGFSGAPEPVAPALSDGTVSGSAAIDKTSSAFE